MLHNIPCYRLIWDCVVKQISFSVIMPVYNRAFCIFNAVNSLLMQSFQNFELIIVDDGSTDNTQDLLRRQYGHELESGKIIYKYIAHAGVCKARNEALKLAGNDWIAYLDSDNILLPDFLDTFAQAVKEHKSQVYYARIKQDISGKIHGEPFDYRALLRGNYIDMGAFVHARSLVGKLGGFDESLTRVVDWDLILRYTKRHKPFYIPKIVLAYNDSQEHQRISNTVDCEVNILRIYEKNGRRLPPVKKQKILGYIRYSCYCGYGKDKNIWDEEYLRYRYNIFQEITLKSLDAQKDKNFNIILLHSVDLPEEYKRRFLILEYNRPYLHNIYLKEGESLNNVVAQAAYDYLDFSKKSLTTFRLDNDDGLPKNYISLLRRHTLDRFCGYALSLPEITLVQRCGEDRYFTHNRIYPSNSIGLALVSSSDDFCNIMNLGHHGKVCCQVPLLCLPETGGLQTINGENVANCFTQTHEVEKVSGEELKQRLSSHFPDFNLRCLNIISQINKKDNQ